MLETGKVTPFHQPGTIFHPLTEIARDGARQMLAAALKAQAASFVTQCADERLPDSRQRVVLLGADAPSLSPGPAGLASLDFVQWRLFAALLATANFEPSELRAEQWEHLRTTNPIESVFATVRHRTVRTKGAPWQVEGAVAPARPRKSRNAKLMVFALVRTA